jgi:hypothetical protein
MTCTKQCLSLLYIGGVAGVCSTILEEKSPRLLNATNYGYNLLGVTIPCVFILAISMIIIYRTCRNRRCTNKDSHSFHYIAAVIGILHSLFNLPARFSDILLMFLLPYNEFYSDLINFNHEVQSFIYLSYAYKCFICILISRQFRVHAKSVLCFLIENQYEDRHVTTATVVNHDATYSNRTKKKSHRQHEPVKNDYSTKLFVSIN